MDGTGRAVQPTWRAQRTRSTQRGPLCQQALSLNRGCACWTSDGMPTSYILGWLSRIRPVPPPLAPPAMRHQMQNRARSGVHACGCASGQRIAALCQT